MAHVFRTISRKDGKPHKRWRFVYTDWQGRRRKGTGYTSKADTEKLALRIQAEHEGIRKGYRPPPRKSETPRKFEEAYSEYVAWGKSQGGRGGRPWSERHARTRDVHLKWWKQELALEMVSDLYGKLADVEKSLRRLKDTGKAGKTVASHAESLSAFCDWAVERRYLSEDPLKKLSGFDTSPESQRRAMTHEEIQLLLKHALPKRRLAYELAFCTGLRANELRQLKVENFDPQSGGLKLDGNWTKNRKNGFQPLPQELIVKLSTECHGKKRSDPLLYVPSHTARDFDKDLMRAGIEKKTDEGKLDFHACRVAYTTFVVEAGATVKEAQSLLRHSTPSITMDIYAKTRGDRLTHVTEKVAKKVLVGSESPTTAQRPESEEEDSDLSDDEEMAYSVSGSGFDSPRLHQPSPDNGRQIADKNCRCPANDMDF